MILKILLLVAVAVAAWWLTRPKPPNKISRDNRHLTPCPKCGVYNEPDTPCRCQKDA